MKDNYARSLKCTLVHEGGWSNHPADPGGATMRGVTQRTYDGYRKRKSLAPKSVRFIEEHEIQDIYRMQYWNAVKGDDMPYGIDYLMFDAAVNSGPSRAVRWLQAALGVKIDGIIGEATVSAAAEHPDHDLLCADMLARRLAFMRGLKTWKSFGKGWSNRIAGAKATAQAWASGSEGPSLRFVEGAQQKATDKDVAKPLGFLAPVGDGAIASGSATSLLSGSAQQLEQFAHASDYIMNLFVALTVAGIALTALGVAVRWYRNQAQARAKETLNDDKVVDLIILDELEFETRGATT